VIYVSRHGYSALPDPLALLAILKYDLLLQCNGSSTLCNDEGL
jgi:hypothetical protein